MELEISVEDLLNKRKIESDRIEFKAGWNPDDIYHSVCAFANDYNNDGGGYIAVGVEEKNGVAVRPVKGIPEYMLDEIQKEMLSYNNMIAPPYFPKAIPLEVDGKWILVIVARTGQQRPYKSPEHVTGKKDKKYNYYIRYLTSSVKANSEQERELINMADQTPYDCRANHKAVFDDISPVLLEDHLRKTGSRLAKQVKERGVEEILEDMQLLVGPPELRYIQNVAIMMFCEHPDRFFPYTYVQMTSFPQGSIENPSVSEDFPNITGSVPQMIQATMERFRNLFIREKVIKVPNQMEALRIKNYPYQAICGSCPFQRKELDYGKKMLLTFPVMRPFGERYPGQCVRIEPQDIGCLPMRMWSLSGNPFLMQGYFQYRHLIFMEWEKGYVIGVPGIYSNMMQSKAENAGFREFIAICGQKNCRGAFGYWLMPLD